MAIEIVAYQLAEQYDGTNGTEISAIFGATVESDDGQILHIWKYSGNPEEGNYNLHMNVTEWIRYNPGQFMVEGTGMSDAFFNEHYRPLPQLTIESVPANTSPSVHVVAHE